MPGKNKKLSQKIKKANKAGTIKIVLFLSLLIALPLIFNASKKQQNLQQNAATPPAASCANGLWAENTYGSGNLTDMDALADKLTAGKINFFFPNIAAWNADGTLSYHVSDADITAFNNKIRARNPQIKIIPWINSAGGPAQDLSTPAERQKRIDQIITLVNKGFDGINEDTEVFTGGTTHQNIADFWNAMAATLKPMGKLSTVAALAWQDSFIDDIYPQLNIDYLIPMLYSGDPGQCNFTETRFKDTMNRILTKTNSPILIGMASCGEVGSVTGWIDSEISTRGPYPKLKGYSLWAYESWWMQPADWTAWNNWTTKDCTPSDSPASSLTPASSPTITATDEPITPTPTPEIPYSPNINPLLFFIPVIILLLAMIFL